MNNSQLEAYLNEVDSRNRRTKCYKSSIKAKQKNASYICTRIYGLIIHCLQIFSKTILEYIDHSNRFIDNFLACFIQKQVSRVHISFFMEQNFYYERLDINSIYYLMFGLLYLLFFLSVTYILFESTLRYTIVSMFSVCIVGAVSIVFMLCYSIGSQINSILYLSHKLHHTTNQVISVIRKIQSFYIGTSIRNSQLPLFQRIAKNSLECKVDYSIADSKRALFKELHRLHAHIVSISKDIHKNKNGYSYDKDSNDDDVLLTEHRNEEMPLRNQITFLHQLTKDVFEIKLHSLLWNCVMLDNWRKERNIWAIFHIPMKLVALKSCLLVYETFLKEAFSEYSYHQPKSPSLESCIPSIQSDDGSPSSSPSSSSLYSSNTTQRKEIDILQHYANVRKVINILKKKQDRMASILWQIESELSSDQMIQHLLAPCTPNSTTASTLSSIDSYAVLQKKIEFVIQNLQQSDSSHESKESHETGVIEANQIERHSMASKQTRERYIAHVAESIPIIDRIESHDLVSMLFHLYDTLDPNYLPETLQTHSKRDNHSYSGYSNLSQHSMVQSRIVSNRIAHNSIMLNRDGMDSDVNSYTCDEISNTAVAIVDGDRNENNIDTSTDLNRVIDIYVTIVPSDHNRISNTRPENSLDKYGEEKERNGNDINNRDSNRNDNSFMSELVYHINRKHSDVIENIRLLPGDTCDGSGDPIAIDSNDIDDKEDKKDKKEKEKEEKENNTITQHRFQSVKDLHSQLRTIVSSKEIEEVYD